MTLLEAEEYFKKYYGLKFHMFREEPERCREYDELNIDPQTEESWRQDVIRDLLDLFFDEQSTAWTVPGVLIDVLFCSMTRLEENCKEMLNLIERMDKRDIIRITRILENMAGYRMDGSDGGCRLICTRTSLGGRMNEIMQRLCTAPQVDWRQWSEFGERFARAVRDYNGAYRVYGKAE